MPFKFAWLCELLEELQQTGHQQRATHSRHDNPDVRVVTSWFNQHNDQICRQGSSALAFLSAVFPERRADRTYNLQPKRLTQIVGRALGLGVSRLRVLESWQQKDGPDFPSCVEKVMAECEFDQPPDRQQVTLEEVDTALTCIAANNIASAPAIRAQAKPIAPVDVLAPILRRLQSAQAKWLIRMILKSYSPIDIPEYAALHSFHFLLPRLLTMQNSLEAAVGVLSRSEMSKLPPRPSKDYEEALLPILLKEITPRIGVMIRRQPFDKARSIKHCVEIARSRTMSVERKYDGEYCQIHIDIANGTAKIQIFSKNGKDATQDRIGLHSVIKSGLRLGSSECKIKYRAILEGELLIYSRNERDILPFHHIRKHVRHGGRRIGTEADSPKKVGEHLMICFFDLLMLDDKILISEPHRLRRALLKGLVNRIDGESQVAERVILDFKSSKAKDLLRGTFAHAIKMRWEGFVLKGLEDPYYSWKQPLRSIKLKKDYIAGLGDSADLCIIAGHRDSRTETDLGLGRLSWTSFYIGCLTNKYDVQRFGARPAFRILDSLGPGSMSKDDLLTLNAEGRLVEREFAFESEHMTIKHPRKDLPVPMSYYTRPMVVEVFGAGFERPQTADFYILRFPRRVGSKIKLHKDRDVADTVDFDELQRMAESSLREQNNSISQDEAEWVDRLLAADLRSKYILDKSQSTSPSKTQHSATTMSLTPVGTRWSSTTQPSPVLVRIDSDELTSAEHHERYPDSAPQTPSRKSDSTMSPRSSRKRNLSRQDIVYLNDSPSPNASRKRKRVTFQPSNALLNARSVSDITCMTKPIHPRGQDPLMLGLKEARQPTTTSAGKQKTKGVPEETRAEKLPSSQTKEAEIDKTESISGDAIVSVVTSNSNAHSDQSQQLQSTNESGSVAVTPVRLPVAEVLPSLLVTQPVYLTKSLVANATDQELLNTILSKSGVKQTTDVDLFSNGAIFPAMTDSLDLSEPPPPSRTQSLFNGYRPSAKSNIIHSRSVILIDSLNAKAAAETIRDLIDSIPLPDRRPTADRPISADILIFDYRILDTKYWKERVQATNEYRRLPRDAHDTLQRTTLDGQDASEFTIDRIRDHEMNKDTIENRTNTGDDTQTPEPGHPEGLVVIEDQPWKDHFCGTLNLQISLLDIGEDNHRILLGDVAPDEDNARGVRDRSPGQRASSDKQVRYEVVGEMCWD